jgi:hypothetical protein
MGRFNYIYVLQSETDPVVFTWDGHSDLRVRIAISEAEKSA